MKTIFVFFTLLALTTAAVTSSRAQERPQYGKQAERTITANPSDNHPVKGLDETDQTFMKEAAVGNQAEIQLGKMAQEKASSQAVKSFGERMIKDHSDADTKLKNIAQSQHISLPIELDPQHRQTAEALSRLSGPRFDQAYMLFMVQEHTKDVDHFKKEAADAHDDTVKQFAAATLPVLQSHLDEANQIQQQLNTR